MARQVFILGAGASRHLGAPLMNDFIDAAYDLRTQRLAPISEGAFDLVFDFVEKRLPRLYAKSKVDLGNIESVFSLLEMGRLLGRLPSTTADQIEAAVAAIRRVLVETLELTCRFPVDSDGAIVPSDPYLALAGIVEEQQRTTGSSSVACLTFDYDIGLDFALHWSNLPIDYGLTPAVHGAVPVLKLHGSLNWLLCPSCSEISVVPLREIFGHQPRNAPGKPRPIVVTASLANRPAHCPGANHDGQPAIVPPSWNKTQYHEKFGKIWKRAAAELAEAQEITVIGYSLPPSDGFFRDLLALGLADGARLRQFRVVDTGEDTMQRFRDLLGPDVLPKFDPKLTTFEDFASTVLRQSQRSGYRIARRRA